MKMGPSSVVIMTRTWRIHCIKIELNGGENGVLYYLSFGGWGGIGVWEGIKHFGPLEHGVNLTAA